MRSASITLFICLFIIQITHATQSQFGCDNSVFKFDSTNAVKRVNFMWPNTEGFQVVMHAKIMSNTTGDILIFNQGADRGGECYQRSVVSTRYLSDFLGRYVVIILTITNVGSNSNLNIAVREKSSSVDQEVGRTGLCFSASSDSPNSIYRDGELILGQNAQMEIDWLYITHPTEGSQTWYAMYDFGSEEPGRDSSGFGNHLTIVGAQSAAVSSDSTFSCEDPCLSSFGTCSQRYPSISPSLSPVASTFAPSISPSTRAPTNASMTSTTTATSTSGDSTSSSETTLIIILIVTIVILGICVVGAYYFLWMKGDKNADKSAEVIEFCDVDVPPPHVPCGEMSPQSSLVSDAKSEGIQPEVPNMIPIKSDASTQSDGLYRERPLYVDSSEEGIPTSGTSGSTKPERNVLRGETKMGEASHPIISSKDTMV